MPSGLCGRLFTGDLGKSVMPGDGMWDIGLFKLLDFLAGQFDAHRRNRVLQMKGFGGADDWCGDSGFVKQPGQCNLRR